MLSGPILKWGISIEDIFGYVHIAYALYSVMGVILCISVSGASSTCKA